MNDTALTSRGGELLRDGIEHGLVAITDPEVNRFDPSPFEIFQQVFPSLFIFSIANAEREYFPLPAFGNSYHGQDRHLTSFAVVDHREVRPIRKGVDVARSQLASLPLLIFA